MTELQTAEPSQSPEESGMKTTWIIAIVAVVVVAIAAIAIFNSSSADVETLDVIQIFDSSGNPVSSSSSFGSVDLTRRDDGLDAKTTVNGLTPDGVYTFWWVVGDAGFALPDAYVASAGGEVIGSSGETTVSMSVDVGNSGILGFLDALAGDLPPTTTDPFHSTFDLDPATAEVHIEIAYHGQASEAGSDLNGWLSDFWTGTACPEGESGHNPGGTTGDNLVESNPAQPHCPVSYVAVFAGT
jgi:hypothetical protein